MPQYLVMWEMDVYASTPREAAEKALACQRDPNSHATVFIVTELTDTGAMFNSEVHDLGVCHGHPDPAHARA